MGDLIRETRNRSRSKTPFLRSQCDSESCAHAGEEGHSHHHEKKKKNPNVQTIIEESIQVTTSPAKKTSSNTITSITSSSTSSSSTSVSKSITAGGKTTTKTSDYSSEDASPETVARIARSNAINTAAAGGSAASSSFTSSSSIKTTTVTTSSAQRSHGNKTIKNISSSAVTSTPKGAQQQSFRSVFGVNKEISQNAINSDFERSAHFSGSNNSSSKISYTEHSNGSAGDHVAYKEYKDAGEYWNKYPKTDYTYSKRSPHRREIAPGVVAMPNMSRRSLENHHDRVTEMIQREPAQEEFIRRRYAYQCTNSGSSSTRKAAESLIYDSQDEVDLAQFEGYRKSRRYLSSNAKSTVQSESWFTRILTTVVTTFYSFWSTVAGNSSESDLYKTRITHEERGFFGRIGHAISSVFIGLFRYVYLAISSVLSLDTWLLKTSNAENKNKKRFLLLLLILLPLLLLAGLYYYLNPNEPFPPRSFSEITLTLPQVDFSEFYNQEQYEALKAGAYNRIDDLRDYTHEYFSYLKTVSNNIFEEGKKLFQENFYYERV